MDDTPESWAKKGAGGKAGANGYAGQFSQKMKDAYAEGLMPLPSGRWPANCILGGSGEVKSYFPNVHGKKSFKKLNGYNFEVGNKVSGQKYESQAGLGEFGSAARFFYEITDKCRVRGLVSYLCKLCTPPQGNTLVVGLDSEAIIGLKGLGFNVFQYSSNE